MQLRSQFENWQKWSRFSKLLSSHNLPTNLLSSHNTGHLSSHNTVKKLLPRSYIFMSFPQALYELEVLRIILVPGSLEVAREHGITFWTLLLLPFLCPISCGWVGDHFFLKARIRREDCIVLSCCIWVQHTTIRSPQLLSGAAITWFVVPYLKDHHTHIYFPERACVIASATESLSVFWQKEITHMRIQLTYILTGIYTSRILYKATVMQMKMRQ